ncbi:uncharacterized protein LOC119180271 isoform X1 [Rhipicephalus microplus]|uniref:uncharacterized protein LOC119180271 isoform X1 n=1 Tax=Rhipicephalus microplus TaxID=6941 RepID=UPI003F6CAE06
MYLQVLLFAVVGQLSSASSDGLPTTVTEDSGVCSGTPLSSFSAHHSPFFRVSDGLPPNLDFTVFAVRQHGATSADPPLQKRAGCIDTSGHGTAAADRRSPIMYLQVLLFAVVGQLSSASSDGLPTTVTEDSGVCSGTPLSSFSAHHSPFFRVSDGLPPNLDFTVFAVRQHGATSADPPLQKRAGCIDTSGHGTAAADRRSPIMYLQETIQSNLLKCGRAYVVFLASCFPEVLGMPVEEVDRMFTLIENCIRAEVPVDKHITLGMLRYVRGLYFTG